MSLTPGSAFGGYAVGPMLGAGGMGEVYQARDIRLGRSVALKVLPDAVAHDRERLARFTREAQTLAALNHPHIAQIYGIEESEGTTALVLEFVDGPTLADRLAHGPVPGDEALAIAAQIAEALEAAHAGGVVHRDLKPANIKIAKSGAVKVLDFGLAKIYADDTPGRDVSLSPTITAVGTRAGTILGTAAYMSPEQARGGSVDGRSDIWAFGCVLFEMLTGRTAFGADTVPDTVVRVLSREPDLATLPGNTPASIVSLLKRCLQKEVDRRLRDIVDARFQIEDALSGGGSSTPEAGSRTTRRRYAGWIVAAVVALSAVVAGVLFRRAPTDASALRLIVDTPEGSDPYSFALSPAGRHFVYSFEGRLWMRSLDQDEGRPLMGTQGAQMPFWSPDGRSVGFLAEGALKRIDLDGGFARSLAAAPNPRSGAWSPDGTILFGASAGPLLRVGADGGDVRPATTLLPGQSSHRWPRFLPDGRRFLFLALGTADVRGVYVGALDTKQVTRLVDGEPAFDFLPPSHLLLTRDGALWAQRLNATYTAVEGRMIPVARRVLTDNSVNGLGALSVSAAGPIAFRTAAGKSQLLWVDRTGREIAPLSDPDDTRWQDLALAPDGATVAVRRNIAGNSDIWLVDARGVLRRLTFDPAVDGAPTFSPDGRRVAYAADPADGLWDIYERPADGTGAEALLLKTPENENPIDWSPDGRFLLFLKQSAKTDLDVWALPLTGDKKPFPIAQSPFNELLAGFSPDGRWVTYNSSESGRVEVYAVPFPGPGARVQLSVGGGSFPQWRRDGRELFYRAPGKGVVAVPVEARGSGLVTGAPRVLFNDSGVMEVVSSPDGQRFLIVKKVSDVSPVSILLNWKPPGG
jgi:serine/threonine protein kinase/Tol biopolymer transport system component